MRLFIFLLLFPLLLSSCSSDEKENMMSNDKVPLYKGAFVTSVHPTSGMVTVNQTKTKLDFANFMTDNGPNLDIYLVSDLSNVNSSYISLGNIKGINGNYTYDIPSNVDLSVYKYIVVWCVDFNVNFGYATLVQQ
jgi:hypothetical protein